MTTNELIDKAAQAICDSSPHGQQWEDHGEPVRNIYRNRARALDDAGLLADGSVHAQIQRRDDLIVEMRKRDQVHMKVLERLSAENARLRAAVAAMREFAETLRDDDDQGNTSAHACEGRGEPDCALCCAQSVDHVLHKHLGLEFDTTGGAA